MTRSRTPSDLKFLLNERAALLGAAAIAERNIPVLTANITAAEARLARRRAQLEELVRGQEAGLLQLRAIELTLAAEFPNVDPNSVNVVKAWAGPGGRQRGALKRLLFGLLQSAAPAALPTSALVAPAAAAFGWRLGAPEERLTAARIVRRVLQKARDAGLVVSIHGTATGREGSWRWVPQEPCGADLLALRGHDQDPNTVGAEVGGQRAGGSHG